MFSRNIPEVGIILTHTAFIDSIMANYSFKNKNIVENLWTDLKSHFSNLSYAQTIFDNICMESLTEDRPLEFVVDQFIKKYTDPKLKNRPFRILGKVTDLDKETNTWNAVVTVVFYDFNNPSIEIREDIGLCLGKKTKKETIDNMHEFCRSCMSELLSQIGVKQHTIINNKTGTVL